MLTVIDIDKQPSILSLYETINTHRNKTEPTFIFVSHTIFSRSADDLINKTFIHIVNKIINDNTTKNLKIAIYIDNDAIFDNDENYVETLNQSLLNMIESSTTSILSILSLNNNNNNNNNNNTTWRSVSKKKKKTISKSFSCDFTTLYGKIDLCTVTSSNSNDGNTRLETRFLMWVYACNRYFGSNDLMFRCCESLGDSGWFQQCQDIKLIIQYLKSHYPTLFSRIFYYNDIYDFYKSYPFEPLQFHFKALRTSEYTTLLSEFTTLVPEFKKLSDTAAAILQQQYPSPYTELYTLLIKQYYSFLLRNEDYLYTLYNNNSLKTNPPHLTVNAWMEIIDSYQLPIGDSFRDVFHTIQLMCVHEIRKGITTDSLDIVRAYDVTYPQFPGFEIRENKDSSTMLYLFSDNYKNNYFSYDQFFETTIENFLNSFNEQVSLHEYEVHIHRPLFSSMKYAKDGRIYYIHLVVVKMGQPYQCPIPILCFIDPTQNESICNDIIQSSAARTGTNSTRTEAGTGDNSTQNDDDDPIFRYSHSLTTEEKEIVTSYVTKSIDVNIAMLTCHIFPSISHILKEHIKLYLKKPGYVNDNEYKVPVNTGKTMNLEQYESMMNSAFRNCANYNKKRQKSFTVFSGRKVLDVTWKKDVLEMNLPFDIVNTAYNSTSLLEEKAEFYSGKCLCCILQLEIDSKICPYFISVTHTVLNSNNYEIILPPGTVYTIEKREFRNNMYYLIGKAKNININIGDSNTNNNTNNNNNTRNSNFHDGGGVNKEKKGETARKKAKKADPRLGRKAKSRKRTIRHTTRQNGGNGGSSIGRRASLGQRTATGRTRENTKPTSTTGRRDSSLGVSNTLGRRWDSSLGVSNTLGRRDSSLGVSNTLGRRDSRMQTTTRQQARGQSPSVMYGTRGTDSNTTSTKPKPMSGNWVTSKKGTNTASSFVIMPFNSRSIYYILHTITKIYTQLPRMRGDEWVKLLSVLIDFCYSTERQAWAPVTVVQDDKRRQAWGQNDKPGDDDHDVDNNTGLGSYSMTRFQ
jgi:hypothetical protein